MGGGQAQQLAVDDSNKNAPDWSRDGTQIAVSSADWPPIRQGIFAIDTQGSGQHHRGVQGGGPKSSCRQDLRTDFPGYVIVYDAEGILPEFRRRPCIPWPFAADDQTGFDANGRATARGYLARASVRRQKGQRP